MNTNKQNNKPWFNWQTRTGKRELRKATNTVSGYPDSSFLRDNYYKVKGCYKKLNEDIEGGKVLNWQAFKKIKRHKETKIQHDSYDMEKFEKFFSNLCSDNHKTIDNNKKEEFIREADTINNNTTAHSTILNDKITSTEVSLILKSLKLGKASSNDKISNEIIKNLDSNHVNFLTSYFNICLEYGIYPWVETNQIPITTEPSR